MFKHVKRFGEFIFAVSAQKIETIAKEKADQVFRKIMVIGGDFRNVENICGHLLFARQVVTKVLTEKVMYGYFTEEEAIKIAKMILHDNAIRILKLDKKIAHL